MKKIILWVMFLTFFILSCQQQVIDKNVNSLSNDHNLSSKHSEHIQLIFAHTGNLLGSIKPKEHLISPSQTLLRTGGLEHLASYLNILQKKRPQQTLLIDNGDIFYPSSTRREKKAIFDFYEMMKFDAILFGLDELIHYKESPSVFKEAHLPFLSSNIINIKTGKPLHESFVTDLKIVEKNGLKIGFLGLSQFSNSKMVDTVINGIYVEDPVLTFLKYRNKLKKRGAHLIVLLTDIPSNCYNTNQNSLATKDSLIRCHKKDNQDLIHLIERLPAQSVDYIIGGGDRPVRGYINGIPVQQGGSEGQYLMLTEVFVNKQSKSLDHSLTRLHPPIKICHEFLEETEDCHTSSLGNRSKILSQNILKKVPAKFLGVPVEVNTQVLNLLKKHRL